jgi:hypothetical protein
MPLLTLSAWVYPRQVGGTAHEGRRQVLSQDDGGFDRSLLMENGHWNVFTGGANWNTGVTAEANIWQHVAVVFESGDVKFYKNGQAYSFKSAPGNGSSALKLMIGQNPSGLWNEFFDGLIDEVHIYNKALTGDQIKDLMNDPEGDYILVKSDLSMDICASYQEKNYSFTLNYFPSVSGMPAGIYWKMDKTSLEMETGGTPSSGCIPVADNLSMNLQVEYQNHPYAFTLLYYPNPIDTQGIYWRMNLQSFEEIRHCIPLGDDKSLKIVASEQNNRFAFTLKWYVNPTDTSGAYWKMDTLTYQQVNQVMENYVVLGESKDMKLCVGVGDKQYGVTLDFYPALIGNYWKLDPASLEEF